MTSADKLREWLETEEKKVSAMQHWYEKNPHIPRAAWDEGPYPAMKNMIAICKTLLDACAFYKEKRHIINAYDTDFEEPAGAEYNLYDVNFLEEGNIARKAIEECLKHAGE